jgi:hypothetical protein
MKYLSNVYAVLLTVVMLNMILRILLYILLAKVPTLTTQHCKG